jgi:hypothetical protein
VAFTGVIDFTQHGNGALEGGFFGGNCFDAEIFHTIGIEHDRVFIARWCLGGGIEAKKYE